MRIHIPYARRRHIQTLVEREEEEKAAPGPPPHNPGDISLRDYYAGCIVTGEIMRTGEHFTRLNEQELEAVFDTADHILSARERYLEAREKKDKKPAV